MPSTFHSLWPCRTSSRTTGGGRGWGGRWCAGGWSAGRRDQRGEGRGRARGPARTVVTVTIPVRPGAARPARRRPGRPTRSPRCWTCPACARRPTAPAPAVDRLLGHKVLRRESAGVSTESALRGARASAALDGVDVPLAALRAGEVDDPLVQGALRVSVALGSMVETWQRAPGQVLARLHVLAAADLADRASSAARAPHAGPRLAGLFALVTGDTTVPAVVVAALVHGELAALAPFGTADGVVARAAGRLTGITRGLDPKAVSVPEVGFAEFGRDAYAAALAGYRPGAGRGGRVAGALLPGDRARRPRGAGHLREPAARLTAAQPGAPAAGGRR